MHKYRLETERLILRPISVDDADAVFVWAGDEEVARYMVYPTYSSSKDVRTWIESLSDEDYEFVFVRKEDGLLIGSGSIGPDRDREGYWGFGYDLRRDCWGRGYATEAARAMMEFAYKVFGITKFSSSHAKPNRASGRVMEKCGLHFVRYGRFQKYDGSCQMPSMEYEGTYMKKGVIYIHGKGGSALEAEHYGPLFEDYDVIGLDYHSDTPWEAVEEFGDLFDHFREDHDPVIVIANSIGAFFAMHALKDRKIEKAFFISLIVDMEKLIEDMMKWAGVSEEELKEKGEIETSFGEKLSWDYLSWVRKHPISWKIPTKILYGQKDHLQSYETIQDFASQIGADLKMMEDGEHWFHTEDQMRFLDAWICETR